VWSYVHSSQNSQNGHHAIHSATDPTFGERVDDQMA